MHQCVEFQSLCHHITTLKVFARAATHALQQGIPPERVLRERQIALEQFGLAGLRAGRVVDWRAGLVPQATAPVRGPLLPRCRSAVLPGTPARLSGGDSSPIGWLLWDAPSAPLPVQTAAIAVLRHLDGQTSLSEVAQALEAPVEAVEAVAAELCRVGAAGPT